MIVYQFTIPLKKATYDFEDTIASEFGGFTSTNGRGGWLNPGSGALEVEDILVYTVAVGYLTDGFRLRGIVRDELKRLGEQAMYFAEIGTARIEFLSGAVPALP